MKLRKLNVVIFIVLIFILITLGMYLPAANAAESTSPVQHKGYIDHTVLVATTKVTRSGETTKGYVGNKPFKLKSTTRGNTTTTKGYVDGKYIRIKTKEDQKD